MAGAALLIKEISFFQETLLKNHLLCAYYLGFDWSGWIVLIKSEILNTTGIVWPLSSDKWNASLVWFSKVKNSRPYHGWSSHFDNESFSQEFLLKNHLLLSCYLGFDWSGWTVLIKRLIIIATGMVWPVSFDKWNAPFNANFRCFLFSLRLIIFLFFIFSYSLWEHFFYI